MYTFYKEKRLFHAKNDLFFVLYRQQYQQQRTMNATSVSPEITTQKSTRRSTRRRADGQATAALLIQMATEILSASPTLRQKANITLTDLAAADKVRKQLLKYHLTTLS